MKTTRFPGKWSECSSAAKSGGTTYQVWRSSNASPKAEPTEVDEKMQEDWITFKLIEEACRNSKYVDYTIFDDLDSDTTPKAFYLKNMLRSIEKLTVHWELVTKEQFEYRIK